MVGRAAGAAVRCDDGALEPHHVLIEVGPAGVTLRQLTGRSRYVSRAEPLTEAIRDRHCGSSWRSATASCRCAREISQHLLRPAISPTSRRLPGGDVLMRSPRAVNAMDSGRRRPRRRDRPASGEPIGGLLPALLALAGSGLLALLVQQPMFFLFGAIGAIAAFGTWGGQQIHVFRRGKRAAQARR